VIAESDTSQIEISDDTTPSWIGLWVQNDTLKKDCVVDYLDGIVQFDMGNLDKIWDGA
jgi:hypothetical protein